ncbi:hypothetical protein IWW37_004584 [Coemansia sp. RSA 2050]|nr:hypothetical protein IWW37_004584 [Coemansia sp. RSA 2050]
MDSPGNPQSEHLSVSSWDLDDLSECCTTEPGSDSATLATESEDASTTSSPKGNVPGWYSYHCEKFLSVEELDAVRIKDIELFFDPIHALMVEDMIANKIGAEKWEEVVEEDAKQRGSELMKRFRVLLNTHMLTPDKNKNMVFVGHIWIINPTISKTRNMIRIKEKDSKFRAAFETTKDLLTSDILNDYLDTKNIIAFDDGVLDMSNFEGGIRGGKPSDFVTTSISYKVLFDSHVSMEEELDGLLSSLFPDDELLDYFLLHMSSCLDSGNLDKLFVIWYGVGNNGKSVLESLVEHTFGSYCYKAPTSLFSSRRTGSSSATPETANFNKTLISFIQESDSRENMNIGVLKELTGNDTIYTRNLYETPKTIEVRCKFILVTNKIYNLSQADEATWARVRVIPFLSKFVNNDEEVDEEQNIFRMNPQYIRRVRKLAPYFMRLLIKTYPRYKANGLPPCKLVQEHTSSLKRLNSPIALFVEDELIEGLENSLTSK